MPHTVIITMAGQGRRFQQAGYALPKYEIVVKGRTLFYWALASLKHFFRPCCHVVLIARRELSPGAFIARECRKLGIDRFDTVLLDELTDGQATTVLPAAQASINPELPVLIYNIDTHVDCRFLRPETVRGDGWIPCFPGRGDRWSFVRVDEWNRALEVREKQRISNHCTIGLYGFSSFHCYESAYKAYYSDSSHDERHERYIAPLYNHLIATGQDVFIEELPEHSVYPLGTPDEVEAFRHGPYAG